MRTLEAHPGKRRRIRGRWGVAAVAIAAACSAGAAPAAGAAGPDLVVTTVSKPPTAQLRGTGFNVDDKTKNGGNADAAASQTRLYLSLDAVKSSGDLLIGSRNVPVLAPTVLSSARTSVTIPSAAPPAQYHLLACADALSVVAETNEANNCRASTTTINVVKTNPLSVTPTLQTAAARKKTITTAGGNVVATGSDGTSFQLVIPKDALLSDTSITLTPVAAIAGLPLSGGLIAGVDMKPEGLRFVKAATLTITPPAGFSVPVERQVGFGYSASGKEFHLEPLAMGTAIRLKVFHFSTRGVGDGTAADRAGQQQRVPTGAEERAAQRLSDLLADQRACQSAGTGCRPPAEVTEAMRSMLRTWHDERLRPLLSRAETDDTVLESAAGELFAWLRQVELLGQAGYFANEINAAWTSFWKAVDNALRKSYDRCVQNHDIAQISRMLSISRLAQIHGHALPADVMELIEKCARFELDVATSLRREGQGAQGTTSLGPDVNVVDLPVRLVFDPAWRLTGEQALEFVSYTTTGWGNTFTGFQNGLPFRVERLMFDINLFGPAQQNRPRQLEMLISHGSAAEHTQAPCPTCQAITWFVYYAGFSDLHASERIAPAPGTCAEWILPSGDLPPPSEPHLFLIKAWETPGGALFARKTYDRRKFSPTCANDGEWVERTTLDLFHTPG